MPHQAGGRGARKQEDPVSDYLTDEEQMARLRDWWQQNGTSLIVGVVLVVIGVVGWRWYQSSVEERIANGSDLYAQWLESQGEARQRLGELIEQEAAGTAYPTFVLFHQARDAVEAGDLASAEANLQSAVTAAPGRELADLARLRLARVLFDLDRGSEALEALRQIRGEGYRALAAELQGDIHLASGDRAGAHEAYASALAQAREGSQRPLLEVKVADTADAGGS
jgi:predicted negative regulator of RcsB-dependent stress response